MKQVRISRLGTRLRHLFSMVFLGLGTVISPYNVENSSSSQDPSPELSHASVGSWTPIY